MSSRSPGRSPNEYLDALAALNPLTATMLGMEAGRDRLPDLSPTGADATNDLAVRTLARLDAYEAAGGADSPEERRCARLLRERLNASIGLYESQEHLRSASNLYSPIHQVRQVFTIMPTNDERDWAAVAARMRALPEALDGYRASLQEGLNRGLPAGPLQITTMLEQFTEWAGESGGDGASWFPGLVAGGPDTMSEDLREAAAIATSGLISLRDWLRDSYAPAVEGASDAVGRERYAVWARYWNGSEPDLDETYAWGWQEFLRIQQEMVLEADKVLPGAGPLEAMSHLDSHGEAIKGADAARQYLQTLMDQVIEELNDTHFDLAAPLRRVEAMIAPAGSAPAPYYTPPSLDFSRPGRTWLPSRDTELFPLWDLIDMWYHEGVPGHHLQLGQWVYVADRLSRYQASLVAAVGANVEGWALYSERLMDELGYFTDPGRRLGYLNAQLWRASRVIVDIGMHLELRIPDESPFRPGDVWTREIALEFFAAHSGLSPAMREGEITRYLGLPGQAISYKLGERAWLAGREAARAAHGADFDLKAWHMAALSLGSLGLDDLTDELSRL